MFEKLNFFKNTSQNTERADYSILKTQIENSDDVDLAVLDKAASDKQITDKEYKDLARNLLAKHEVIQGGMIDVTEKQDSRIQAVEVRAQEAEASAETDPLTGLANRRSLDKNLLSAVLRLMDGEHKRESDPDYILYFLMDMDGLKQINDTGGHTAGDQAIRIISERLQEEEKRGGLAARLGGDEFVLMQEHQGEMSDEGAEEIRKRIEERINKNLSLISGDINYPIGVSVGCAVLRKNAPETQNKTPEEVVKNLTDSSDQAMYKIKLERKSK